jgi:hypothetical protein
MHVGREKQVSDAQQGCLIKEAGEMRLDMCISPAWAQGSLRMWGFNTGKQKQCESLERLGLGSPWDSMEENTGAAKPLPQRF